MKQLSREDRETAKNIAMLLESQHKNHNSQCKLADDFVYKGYCGEIHFAREFGLDFKFIDRPGGDNGIDFDCRISIDVKTVTLVGFKNMREARPRRHLMVKEGRVVADVYVLCGYLPDARCELIGWEHKDVIRNIPPRVFPAKGGISNHVIQGNYLQPMSVLKKHLWEKPLSVGVPDNEFGGLF